MSTGNQKDIARETRNNILNDLYNTINLRRQNNDGRLLMSCIAAVVKDTQAVCPWITCDIINDELRYRKRLGTDLVVSNDADLATTSVTDVAVVQNKRLKGDRPDGMND